MRPPIRPRDWPPRRRRAALALALVVAVGLGWLLTSPLRRTAETVYTPAVDTYVSTAHPDTNYGTTPVLRADATPKIRSYLRFRLDRLPGPVVGAELRLWSRTGDLIGYSVHPVAGTGWDELGVTSDNGPAAGAPLASSGPFGPGSWSRADVTRLVQGRQELSLALTTRSRQNITFDSREGANKPQLVVRTRPRPAASAAAPAPPGQWLRSTIEQVGAATGARYATRDDRGQPMDTLKIIASPAGGYLGVYHTIAGDRAEVRVATSGDLLRWRQRATLDRRASQPTVAALSDGGFLVALEAHGDPAEPRRGRWLRFRYYPTLAALLAGDAGRSFDAPRTLTTSADGAEGTPSIYQATLAPDLDHSTIQVGFHHRRDGGVDRPARGTLSGFSRWVARADSELAAALERAGVRGHIGDRDHVSFQGTGFDLVEAQAGTGPDHPWQVHLYQPGEGAATALQVRTAKGSRAFANPTITLLRGPSGAPAVVVTLFLPDGGAGPGEAGQLVYYREYGPRPASPDPVVAAAGDLVCAPDAPVTATTCRQQATSDLLVEAAPTAVLALGDLQYEDGELDGFVAAYDRSWGRLKSVTRPVPGNHEYHSGGAGYFDYFGPAAGDRDQGWYSHDVGAWHLIALNSNCRPVGGCGPGSPQERWLRADLAAHPDRCTLAYWHHPRFSSGGHGSDEEFTAFWRALQDAGAELVLTGHDHGYERFAPQDHDGKADPDGIRQFVVGSGGKSLRPFKRPEPNSEVRNADTFGVLLLTLHDNGYDWRFAPEPGGTFSDSGSGSCR